MSSALPTKLVTLTRKPARGQSGMGPRGLAWRRQHRTSPAHGSGQDSCARTIIPSLLGCSWGEKRPSPWGSADCSNSHVTKLDLSPAPCHSADITRALISPPSQDPTLPGDPQKDLPPLLQAAIDPPRASLSSARASPQTLSCWAGHRSGATFHVLATSPSQ